MSGPGGAWCAVAVTEPDGKSYMRYRLMIPLEAGMAAAFLVLGGASQVTLYPDSPDEAFRDGQLAGDTELMEAAVKNGATVTP